MPVPDDLLELAAAWRPQRPGRLATRDIRDALVEPDWGGVRVVAALAEDEVVFVRAGAPITVPDELSAAALAAFLAAEALVEGHLSTLALRGGEGTAPSLPKVEHLPVLIPRFLRPGLRDDESARARELERREETAAETVLGALGRGERHVFVATDLLHLDGTSLLDVPLLERKRLLEGILEPSFLVRVSPYVKPTAVLTLVTWGTQGFGELHYRAANGRYRLGEVNPDCAVARPPEGPQGPAKAPSRPR
jgi:hypothetical protein